MKAIGPKRASPSQRPVESVSQPDRQTLHATRERLRAPSFNDEVHMVSLKRVVHDAKSLSMTGVGGRDGSRESLEHHLVS
jgi:hypothetical protein